jgi:hypothetical protein
MRKSIELSDEAGELRRRAEAAEENKAISSDDPEAPVKLRERIAALEAEVEHWKEINKAVRSKDPAGKLRQLGVSDAAATRLLKGDELGRKGVPSYKLSNQGANIRRLKARLAELERAAATDVPEPYTYGGGSVTWDVDLNRIIVKLPGGELTREDRQRRSARMKSRGFVWADTLGAFVRKANQRAWLDGKFGLEDLAREAGGP